MSDLTVDTLFTIALSHLAGSRYVGGDLDHTPILEHMAFRNDLDQAFSCVDQELMVHAHCGGDRGARRKGV